MKALWRALGSEIVKLRRTLALWMTLLAPLLVVLFQFLNFLERGRFVVRPDSDAWSLFVSGGVSIWGLFMLPLLIALETALLGAVEHNQRAWKHLFALPAPRWTVILAKQIVALLAVLTGSAVLVAGLGLAGAALGSIRPELGLSAAAAGPALAHAARAAGLAFLASWLVVAIQSWVAMRWPSTALALGVGVAGTFFALFAAGSAKLRFYPWALPLYASSSREGGPTALSLGLAGGVIAAALVTWELGRRDVPT